MAPRRPCSASTADEPISSNPTPAPPEGDERRMNKGIRGSSGLWAQRLPDLLHEEHDHAEHPFRDRRGVRFAGRDPRLRRCPRHRRRRW
ncbi:protein of unknown function [Rhodovastum atsumiense]|nr:protein of unknown function [Rhodovastum atsumiense]